MKLLVAITRPDCFSGETSLITRLFSEGLMRLHLRKPDAPRETLESLLRAIPPVFYPRIALHDHFELAEAYALGGVHLNGRNPTPPPGWCGRVSRSCHSLDEVARHKASVDYVFLSPVFDSLSKAGYRAAFAPGALDEAAKLGIIDRKVVALGGVSAKKMPQVRAWGFGGIALLGAVWQSCRTPADAKVVLSGLSGL